MVDLPEDTPLDVVDHLIAEAEEHRIEQVALIEHLSRLAQSTVDAESQLSQIEEILATLLRRRAYLQAS
ncbi:hypothetical protein [Methylobacterium oxalidis]|uniref:Uncharacterized protein n=1 Tax=Methylobacterium oxalidis TaxID=944322 RepID=A0A512J8N7_9HYPH|nr:hypothetical protein [Methylobacterium oxalidis]GEP06326.1 hypothetical protein MOX02_43640 [Methylobacterium oxalidis]GJE30890.1 hypothetical protein LDDCCGHA_1060 [Methylobacterium oxalidis]GLS64375.1 hypothetical protein GCM10007888_27560 [Methylobacterium oxalidis]